MKGKMFLQGKYYFVSERVKDTSYLVFPCLYTNLSGGDRTIAVDGLFRCAGFYYNIEEVSKDEYDDFDTDRNVFLGTDEEEYEDNVKVIKLKPEIPESDEINHLDLLVMALAPQYIKRATRTELNDPDLFADNVYKVAEAILRRRLR